MEREQERKGKGTETEREEKARGGVRTQEHRGTTMPGKENGQGRRAGAAGRPGNDN